MSAQYGSAREDDRCECCGRHLYGHACRWLELDRRDMTYHDRQDVPSDYSQGWFVFGLACAKRLIKHGGSMEAARKSQRRRITQPIATH